MVGQFFPLHTPVAGDKKKSIHDKSEFLSSSYSHFPVIREHLEGFTSWVYTEHHSSGMCQGGGKKNTWVQLGRD